MPPSTKSPRVKSTGLATKLDFEIAIDRVAYATTELRAAEAERDAAVQAAQATHAERISELQDEIKAKAALCEKFADEHRADLLPGKAKSNETPFARYGFRDGNPTLKLLNKKCSWDSVVAGLKLLGLKKFIRTFEEPDKDGIKTAQLTQDKMDMLGLRIAQSETFYIEPKVDGAEPVKGGAS